jgi:hypothetical protein
LKEPISKRFSLAKVKADQNFNRRNTLGISRIEIFIQRGDWPKWDVLKQARKSIKYFNVSPTASKAVFYAVGLSRRIIIINLYLTIPYYGET